MASKVNVKFVTILISVLVVIALVVGFAGWKVIKKSGEEFEALGDQAMAEGDYTAARGFYAKAVNRDQTNPARLEKWIESLEHWQPPTQTTYSDGYFRTYMLAKEGLARAQRNDPDAQLELLDHLRRQQLIFGYNRRTADSMVERVTELARVFEDQASPPEGWQRILRYRGLARGEVFESGDTIEPDQIEQAFSDLRAAVAADPADGESMSMIMRMLARQAGQELAADRPGKADELYAQAMSEGAAYLERTPDDPWVLIRETIVNYQREEAKQTLGLLPDESREVRRRLLPTMRPAFDRCVEAVRAHSAGLDLRVLARLAQLERAVAPEMKTESTLLIGEEMLEQRPEDALLLNTVATLYEQAGQPERAQELLARLSALPDLPMSLDGFLRFPLRQQAVLKQADLLVREYIEKPDDPRDVREQRLADAKRLRDRYAEQAPPEDSDMMFVDGQIAMAEEDLPEALRLFSAYNTQRQQSDPRGLWRLGQVALRLNNEGTAETAFGRLVELEPANASAILALAETRVRLQKFDSAAKLLERVVELDPTNEAARERLAIVRGLVDPTQADDPVVGALISARKTRFGDETTVGNLTEAERALSESFEILDHDPRVARELIVYRVELGDIEGAREAAAQAAESHPEDTGLAKVADALAEGTKVEAFVRLIDEDDRPELEKLLSKRALYDNEGMTEEADRMLAQAVALDPDDPRVFEAEFLRRLGAGEAEALEPMVNRAAELNVDHLGGLSFKARRLAAMGRYEDAIEAMQQAIAQGAAPLAAYRLLAAEQRAAGQHLNAVTTLEQALAIKPDNVQTINDYLLSLSMAGRDAEALDVARRSEVYGRGNRQFIDVWLTLESTQGGAPGRALAIKRREQMLANTPEDRSNKIQLSTLYIDAQRWADSKKLIDELEEDRPSLAVTQLLARWYADQGRVEVDGRLQSGLDLARGAFTSYIVSIPEDEMTAEPWMVMASFMAQRGELDTAARALEEARPLQIPGTMAVDKALGDLMLSRARFPEANDAYERVIQADADDERQTYLQRLIETALRLERYERASELLATLREPAASSMTTLLQKAETARGLGRPDEARQLLDRAVQQFPDNPLPYTLRARSTLVNAGLVEDALADLDAALRIDPNFTRAQRMRAAIFFDQDRVDDALQDLRDVVRNDPSQRDVATTLVYELNRLGRTADALAVIDEILEKRPFDIESMMTFGIIFGQQDDWANATRLFERAWARGKVPNVGARLIDANLRRSPKRIEQARAVLKDLRATLPNPEKISALWSLQAAIDEGAGQRAAANEAMTQAFRLAEGNSGLIVAWYNNLGEVFRNRTDAEIVSFLQTVRSGAQEPDRRRWLDLMIAQRQVESEATRAEGQAALRSLQESAEGDAVTRVAFRVDGGSRYTAEDYAGARRAWVAGLERFPDDWEMANNLAFMLVDKLDDAAAALPYAEQAVQNAASTGAVYDTLATVYLAMDRLDEARQTLETADRLATTTRVRLDVMLNRARLEAKEGRPSRARALLSDAQELLPTIAGDRETYQTEIDELLKQLG